MAVMQYPRNYEHCKRLWATVKTPAKGKQLGNKWFRLMENGGVFTVHYGGWGVDSRNPIAPGTELYTIHPDDRWTLKIPVQYDPILPSSFRYVMMQKGVSDLRAEFKKSYESPGWYDDCSRISFPLFTGYSKARNSEILTPITKEIADEVKEFTQEMKEKARGLIKTLRIYDKFNAFNEKAGEIHNSQWDRENIALVRGLDFETLNKDNADSLIEFIAARKNFGEYLYTNTAVERKWTGHTIIRTVDYQKNIPMLLRYGAFTAIAKKRTKLLEAWYNKE